MKEHINSRLSIYSKCIIHVTFVLFLFSFSCTVPVNLALLDKLENTNSKIPRKWCQEPIIAVHDSTILSFESNESGNWIIQKNVIYYYVNKRLPLELETIKLTLPFEIQENHRIHLSLRYPDGRIKAISNDDIILNQLYIDGKYATDDKVAEINIPAYQKGMIIRIEFEYNIIRPEFLSTVYLRGQYPVMNRVVCFTSPESLKGVFLNNEGLTIDSAVLELGDNITKRYTVHNLEKIQNANNIHNPEEWYAGLHFSIPPVGLKPFSWIELGEYHLKVLNPILDSMLFIENIIDKKNTVSEDSIIPWAFNIVRNKIRYHADFSGNHSFIPRPVDKVLKNGYGDCKEMASLLAMLLRSKGLNAGIALTTLSGEEQGLDYMPSLGWFNHAVTYLEDDKKEIHLLDPTMYTGAYNHSANHLIDQKLLVLKKDSSYLAISKPESDYVNRILTVSTIIKKDDKWEMSGNVRFIGQMALEFYPYITNASTDEKEQIFKKLLDEFFHIITIDVKLTELSEKVIELKYSTDISQNYVSFDQNGLRLNRPSLAGGDNRYSTLKTEGPRTFKGIEQLDKWVVDGRFRKFENDSVDNEWFKGKWIQNNDEIIRTFKSKANIITIKDSVQIKEYFNSRKKFMDAYLWE